MLQMNRKSGVLAGTLLSKTFAVVLALSLVLGGLGGLVVAAEDAAPVISNVYSATLPAGTGTGSFAHYELAYSAGTTLIVTVRSVYTDASQGSAFGVNLYGAPGLVTKGAIKNDGAYIEVRYVGDAADTLTAQVYNYSNQPVSFDLEVVGADSVTALDAESAPDAAAPEEAAAPTTPAVVEPVATEAVAPDAAAPEAAAAPTTPAVVEPVATPETVTPEAAEPAAADATEATPMVLDISATLIGETAGAYARYEVVVPEDAAPLLVTFRPLLDKSFGATVGFGVYGTAGLAASGQSDGAGAYTATLAGAAGETFVIQVYNYAPGQPVDYSLQVSR